MPLVANPDAGPIFLLGAVFPTWKCMDDDHIAINPRLWADRTNIVGLSTAGQLSAHNLASKCIFGLTVTRLSRCAATHDLR
jgi:hypothetical protein